MARYTCLFTVAAPVKDLQHKVSEILEACSFDIIYAAGDYLMAREIPGQVVFSKLVTVEVLIDKTTATEREVRMSFVVKNEELPLQVDNHCRQVFELVNRAITENRQWQLIDSVAG